MPEDDNIVHVDIDSLVLPEELDRTNEQLTQVSALKENLRAVGQITPIVITKLKDDPTKYWVVTGKRRVNAAKQLGWASIKAVYWEGQDSLRDLTVLSDNTFNRQIDVVVRAKLIQRLFDDKTYKNQAEVAAAMGVTQSTISQWLAVLDESQEVQEAIQAKVLSAKAVAASKQLKDSKAAPVKSLEDVQKQIRDREYKKLAAACTRIKNDDDSLSGQVDTFVNATNIRFVLTFPILGVKGGIKAAIDSVIDSIGEEEIVRGISDFRTVTSE